MTLKVKLGIFLLSVASLSLLWRSDFTQRLQLRYNDTCPCEVCFSSHHTMLNHHLRRSVKPFLSANTSVSEETFQWWKRLQKEKHKFTYFKSTLDKLFKIISPIPDLIKPSPDKCRTCAVVGNSVNLKGSHYGPLIDFQDIVIRMNYAKIKGYEEDVGTRTTHHVMYPESAVDLDNSTHLVLFPFKVLDLQWVMKAITMGFYGRSYAPIKTKIKANKDLVMVLNPAFMRYVHEIWLKKKGNYPSTGFMAFIFALHICDEVCLLGNFQHPGRVQADKPQNNSTVDNQSGSLDKEINGSSVKL
ncbi:PREDICTED: CMP-N-acetylneuraminate-beta-galactosamide-alpha-2,3-sialyltransferase 1-like [Cyprinodon variegatus]|uniref:CMP-N-acetylneuraminate-beta-galactosamide- alpha-2,3-sialyltransferase 1-like n=1 Tax=Cyprinodon variegatus TaxID=28743 RepID=UPI000742C293|nr:PREDICTED: CMP-N-acetylneuraminate-beta-galactosamide-alpha-2,3-sialyltransferase 1-like [Cyprinodon variegatus]